MDPETLRRFGHRVVDWIADYRASIRDRPVLPDVAPGDVRRRLPARAPERGEPMEAILADFEALVLPGMTHWNHPRFFAYFPANNSAPSILAEMLTAALGAQCMSWQTSPAATELEETVMAWLGDALGLAPGFSGVIQDTASTATLVALLMARERATGFRWQREGPPPPGAGRLRVYASEEAHSSVEKGVFLAGLGRDALRRIPTDEALAMRPEALARAVAEDRARGDVPAAIVVTTGTTSSTALDPLPEVAAFAAAEGIFCHVDAAFAGTAALLPEMRHLVEGTERVDSWLFNPHKWMLVNFDCTAHFVRDPSLLERTCSIQPDYLKTARDAEVRNFRDWGIPLGRRFRALKLWFVLRSFGLEGLRAHVRRHLALARDFAATVEGDPRFELAAPVPLSLVCFRLRAPGADEATRDRLNRELLERVNRSRRLFLTHTRIRERTTLRLAIGQEMTGAEEVREAWETVSAAATALVGPPGA